MNVEENDFNTNEGEGMELESLNRETVNEISMERDQLNESHEPNKSMSKIESEARNEIE